MVLPIDLFLLRHGASEANDVYRLGANGDMSGYTEEFKNILPSDYRLSDLGQEQARKAGIWLKEHGFDTFGYYRHSSYLRAKETAGHLGLKNPEWRENHVLREVAHGDMDGLSRAEQEENFPEFVRKMKIDAFHTMPPNGESIAQMTDRLRWVLLELEKRPNDKNAILVCHSDVMWGFTQLIEEMPIPDWQKINSSKDPFHQIHNCQIIQYSRRNPDTGAIGPYWNWVRWVCPWNESLSRGTWGEVHQPYYGNEELLAQVDMYPRLPQLQRPHR